MSPIRATIALAAIGQAFVVLAAFGVLKPWVMAVIVVAAVLVEGQAPRLSTEPTGEGACRSTMAFAIAAFLLLLPLALYPPVAFDETCYHLPFIDAIAKSGAIEFRADFRFPVFPLLHEILCVPAFLIGGATATHLVALGETVLLLALLLTWPNEQKATRFLAAAIVIGNPILIELGTVTYVDVALTLFIAAGFYCLDEEHFLAAGFLLGTAASVKYLGLFFVIAGLFAARRAIARYSLGAAAGLLPMYGVLFALTGDPLFPYLKKSIWSLPPISRPVSEMVIGALRLLWDITFARARVNWQPPYSPLFAIAIVLLLVPSPPRAGEKVPQADEGDSSSPLARTPHPRFAHLLPSWRGEGTRAATVLAYLAIFTFLPQDSRYLLPLLPLVSLPAARHWQRWRVPIAALSIAIAIGYTGFRLVRQGWPDTHYVETRIPEIRALRMRGEGRIYQCGAEQLKFFGGRDLAGDQAGPWAYNRMIGQDLSAMGFRYLLVSHRACPDEWERRTVKPGFERVYQDRDATLWRVPDSMARSSL